MNMAWDLGAVDGAWELCGLLNYGCWIWCLCYILQWDRRRGGSEGQSHSPGIWNGGTEICRNISDEKILSSPGSRYSGIYVSSIFCCGVSGHLMSRMVTESQDVGGTGNCPGPWRPTVHSVNQSQTSQRRKHRACLGRVFRNLAKWKKRNLIFLLRQDLKEWWSQSFLLGSWSSTLSWALIALSRSQKYFVLFLFYLILMFYVVPPPPPIDCWSDHVTEWLWPQARHTSCRSLTTELFVPCVVCSQHSWWWEPHIIGFVVCANYIRHQAPIIGSLSHSNWDFLSPSCHHNSYQSGSVNIWGQDCFITGKCFLHDLNNMFTFRATISV